MLKREDIDNLFDLLAIFRKNDPHLEDKKLRSAWLLVLSPYERDDVRNAIGAWFRKSKYWPEPAEIAALCPPLTETNQRKKMTASEIRTVREDMERMEKYLQTLRGKDGEP